MKHGQVGILDVPPLQLDLHHEQLPQDLFLKRLRDCNGCDPAFILSINAFLIVPTLADHTLGRLGWKFKTGGRKHMTVGYQFAQ